MIKKKRHIKKNKSVVYLLVIILIIALTRFIPNFYNFLKKNSLSNKPIDTKNSEGDKIIFKNYPNGIEKDTAFVQNSFYHIYYIKNDNLFLISIIGNPFENIVPVAENDFLNILGIDEKNACKLNVKITTPRFANPDEAGKIFGLSFCNK